MNCKVARHPSPFSSPLERAMGNPVTDHSSPVTFASPGFASLDLQTVANQGAGGSVKVNQTKKFEDGLAGRFRTFKAHSRDVNRAFISFYHF